jgi:SulP family sulfate permease
MSRGWLERVVPLAATLRTYRRDQFAGDLVAGLVVAVMLVPQAMAYAMLAGLPPQVGLYASVLPLILYSFFGTSNFLAVGPVAMVSLLVFTGVGELATPGSPEFANLCLTLALLAGVLQILMSLLRLGFLVNLISHPVLTGFTSAAAIVI